MPTVADNLRAAGVKERPILFSTPMVRAILDGSKTQTRRLNGLGIVNDPSVGPNFWKLDGRDLVSEDGYRLPDPICPCGQVGDRLWVRETFAENPIGSGPKVAYLAEPESWFYEEMKGEWRPSIHMPRWASRITLEITEVRVQRLRDISEDDVRSEGIALDWAWPENVDSDGEEYTKAERASREREAFEGLWDSINAKKHPWDSNPFVWALTFEVVK